MCAHKGARARLSTSLRECARMDRIAKQKKKQRIRLLNDHLRTSFTGGKVMLTAGVDALPAATKAAVLAKVQGFKAFSADNDPHGEHDFVNIEHEGTTFFAKID